MKYGIVDEEGAFLKKSAMDTRASEGGEAIAAKVENIVEKLRKDGEPEGICISTAGMVDTEEGKILYSAPLIPEYTGNELEEKTGGPGPRSQRRGK